MSQLDESPFLSDLALVTGASTPMGLRIVHELAKEGRDFLLHDYSQTQVEKIQSELEEANPDVSVTALSGDILAPTFAGKLFDALGGRRIQVLVHAGGIAPPQASSTDHDHAAQQQQQHHQVSEANFLVAKKLVETLQPRMEEGGVIILIASLGGTFIKNMLVDFGAKRRVRGSWSPTVWLLNKSHYTSHAVSERCIQLYVRHKAPELAALGVRIVSISPGLMETGAQESPENIQDDKAPEASEQTPEHPLSPDSQSSDDTIFATCLANAPIHRVGRPDEVSAVVSFVASSRASYITGTDIAVDGGLASQRWAATRRTASVVVNDKVEKMQQKSAERTHSVHSGIQRRMSTFKKPRHKVSNSEMIQQDGEKTSDEPDETEAAKTEATKTEATKTEAAKTRDENTAISATTEIVSRVESVTDERQSLRPKPSIGRRYSVPNLRSTWGSVRGRFDKNQQEVRASSQQQIRNNEVTASNIKANSHDGTEFRTTIYSVRTNVSEPKQPKAASTDKEEDVAAIRNEKNSTQTSKQSETVTHTSGHSFKSAVGSIRDRFHRFQEKGAAPRAGKDEPVADPPPMEISLPLNIQAKPLVSAVHTK